MTLFVSASFSALYVLLRPLKCRFLIAVVIHCLVGKQILSREEKVTDNAIGWLTTAPFGIPDFINGIKNVDKEFYLVNQADKQLFVIVTDEFIESRQLREKITTEKFEIGNISFIDCGIISELDKDNKNDR